MLRETSDSSKRAISVTSNKPFYNGKRATSEFVKSNEQILYWVTSDFKTSNEQQVNLQRVKSQEWKYMPRSAKAENYMNSFPAWLILDWDIFGNIACKKFCNTF